MSPWRGFAAAGHGRYQVITPGSYGVIALVDQLVARVRAETGRK